MEMAISMLIIVPVVLYALFLDDLLRYRLDAQEAATSSVWDLTDRSYQQRSSNPNDAAVIQHVDRLIFCDHSSAYDSFNQNQDCNDSRHHKAVAGHVCWLVSGSEQVTCTKADSKLGTDWGGGPLMMPANDFASSYNQGGFFTCEAKESVLNYLIPKHFFTQFTHVKLTDKKKFSGDVHKAAASASPNEVYPLPKEQLGLLADTWAMNDIPDIDAQKSMSYSGAQKQFYDRVNTIYTKNLGYYAFMGTGMAFFVEAVGEGVLSPFYIQTPWGGGMGDNPFKPHVSLKKQTGSSGGQKQSIDQGGSTASYFDTPWDSNTGDSTYKTIYSSRGQYYLGHKNSESSN